MYIDLVKKKIFQTKSLSAKENVMKTRNEVIDKLAAIRGLYAGALRERRFEEAGHLLSRVRAMEWVLEGPAPRVRPAGFGKWLGIQTKHTRRVR